MARAKKQHMLGDLLLRIYDDTDQILNDLTGAIKKFRGKKESIYVENKAELLRKLKSIRRTTAKAIDAEHQRHMISLSDEGTK